MGILIREARESDMDRVWNIFSQVVATGDTFAFSPNTSYSDFIKYWFANHMKTYVIEDGPVIQGSYFLKPNQPDLGSHIANAGYMVNPLQNGKGIGSRMCEHSIQQAKELQYRGIQFNIVVSTNSAAVKLWRKFGFDIIGTTPGGFNHKKLGYVDSYIMFKSLI